jgi:2-polyprenyl-3-methyl-5-hydroxy-6-metoxy-1,4-benzoquinol methylase
MAPPQEPDEAHVFSQEFWDERYAGHDHVWSGRPNARLVEHAADLPPGIALDVGCGEGADVVWLAERGWRATGADLSVVALEKARKYAGEAGVADRTEWVHVDLLADDPLPGDADLVSAMYVHVPETDLRNPHLSHLLFPPDRVTSLLDDDWQIDVAEARTRDVSGHDDAPRVATDTVVVARRT